MSLFTIGDLHLSLGVKKPMDIFSGWENYVDLLRQNWLETVGEEDTVVIPGDFSWAMNLTETQKDFTFLASLPGKKILLRGNHDYWWTSVTKTRNFLASLELGSIDFLQNNYIPYEGKALCGTRGWFFDSAEAFSEKVAAREAIRLELSLQAAEQNGFAEKIVFLHFPPLNKVHRCDDLIALMQKYGVKACYYGHLHGFAIGGAWIGPSDGIDFQLVSADHLKFIPKKIG